MNEFIGRLLGILRDPVLRVQEGSTFWLPPQGATIANEVDWNFNFIYSISVFFFLLVTAITIYFIVKYRRREERMDAEEAPSHHTTLEVTWTVIPLIIVLFIFYFGFRTFLNKTIPPDDAYEINVTGQKWNWLFTYKNPYYVSGDLHVPANRPIQLVMTSEDVIHSMYIPAFRVKMDVVPGRYSKLWFEAETPGEYPLFCAEYCGTSHSDMIATVVVHEPGEFETWLEDAANYIARIADDDYQALAEAGRDLYQRRGCVQCHSTDGTRKNGPSFQGVWGKEEPMADGSTVTVDENYVRESILEPQAKIRAGYDPVMPTYQGKLSDKEITALIEFIKTLKEE